MQSLNLQKIDKADLESIGYAAASQGDVTEVLARELVRRYPTGELSDEAKADLEKGMIGRKAELMGEALYIHKGNEYTAINSLKQAKPDDAVTSITVQYAAGLSAYDFGQMKKNDPAKYDIVAAWRNAVNKYKSNRMNALMSAVKAVLNNTKGRTRGANKAYAEFIGDVAKTMIDRRKTAAKNSDPTAPKDKAELKKMICDAIDKA
jgi:hypothetical protein